MGRTLFCKRVKGVPRPGWNRADAELSGGMRAVELRKEIAKIAESAKK